ncbi:YggT family protein [Candidatus Saccharibacteria bacterium]|nr:YggT family protein [Candidatus Saccharibacteria bacterium]
MKYSKQQMVEWQVHFFVGVAELLLLLRVVLRFFNGNPDATFVHWVYTNTQVLIEPVRNVFVSAGVIERGWVVDYVALFTMAVYAAAGYLLIGLLNRWVKK